MRPLPLILALATLPHCASAPNLPATDHFNGSVFYNDPPAEHMGALAMARHVMFGRNSNWPGEMRPVGQQEAPALKADTIRITFINHATLLIEFGQVAILTDPVWSTRVGPYAWAGPRRATEPGIAFEHLPRITAVVISHNHFDNLDLPTLRRLKTAFDPQFIVPLAVADLIHSEVSPRVTELDWWQPFSGAGYKVVMTPARHNSRRGLFDQDKTLWASYAIFADKTHFVYFAGDTAYGGHFREIRQRLGTPVAALLPIGAYEPNEIMRHAHVNPAEAVRAHRDLGSPLSIAMHFGTFNLTAEDIDSPAKDLLTASENAKLKSGEFVVLREGDYRDIRTKEK